PSFKGLYGFPYSCCLSPNSVVVHGFATDEPLQSGDILTVDCGVFLNGYHADSAYTYPIGEVSPEVQRLLDETKASLYKGIEQAIAGNRVGDISYAIQNYVAPKGYGVVRELVGHGVGALGTTATDWHDPRHRADDYPRQEGRGTRKRWLDHPNSR
nr:methionine aminopeptidase 1D, chloroplastic/mitochondrial [Tanacetum cinerariifolium]